MAGGPLAQRRFREVQESAKILGISIRTLRNKLNEYKESLPLGLRA